MKRFEGSGEYADAGRKSADEMMQENIILHLI